MKNINIEQIFTARYYFITYIYILLIDTDAPTETNRYIYYEKSKNHKSGNVSVLRFNDNEKYTMADLLYVNSQHNSIDRMYRFLQVFYQWTLNKNHIKTAIQVVKDSNVDMNIIRIMKKEKYLDEKCNWILENQPSKADAVYLRLKLKKK